jgi:hypothetical protein
MPLNTQITRNGEPLKISWGGFHVAAMVLAVTMDSGEGPFKDNSREAIYPGIDDDNANERLAISLRISFELTDYSVIGTTPLNDAPYVLNNSYTFVDTTDGEVFELKAGDILRAWRSWK